MRCHDGSSDTDIIEMETSMFRSATMRRPWGAGQRALPLILVFTFFAAGCVAIPTKNEPAGYTQAFVQDAIRLYNQEGRQAAIDHYSSPESVDGQWYVFMIGEDDRTVAHPRHERIGLDPSVRVDSTGHFYGDDILSATEAGKWVSYVYRNPETGEEGRKHSWVVLHDGLIFGSGWYEKE